MNKPITGGCSYFQLLFTDEISAAVNGYNQILNIEHSNKYPFVFSMTICYNFFQINLYTGERGHTMDLSRFTEKLTEEQKVK